MPTYNESNRISDFLKWEVNPQFTRETVVLASGQNLKAGHVVGKITATGKFTSYDDNNGDGSEVAAGVLLYDCDASAADKDCVILKRGPAIVASASFAWGAGVLAGEKTTALADLAALDIIDRPQA
jgi:hypothetical protein